MKKMDQKTLIALAEKYGGMLAKAGKEKCVIFDAKSLTEEQIRLAVHKAEKYDGVVKALNVADNGQYRNDMIEYVVSSARETAKTKGLVERIAQERDGCMYDAVCETIDVGAAIRASAKQAA